MRDIRPLKKKLRAEYKSLRAAIPEQEKEKMDESITNCFIRLPSFNNCDTILLYVSIGSEISTKSMIEHCFAKGKRVALPRCEGKRLMNFYLINSCDDLRPGVFGIPEPDADICEKLTDFDNSLCLVPGLAFDKFGGRLGYGGGYYDSFLSGFSGTALGLCYSMCITDKCLPGGKYDYKLSSYITEKGIFVCDRI